MQRLEGKVDKGWGYEIIWILNEKYCGKILFPTKKVQSLVCTFQRKRRNMVCLQRQFYCTLIDTKTAHF